MSESKSQRNITFTTASIGAIDDVPRSCVILRGDTQEGHRQVEIVALSVRHDATGTLAHHGEHVSYAGPIDMCGTVTLRGYAPDGTPQAGQIDVPQPGQSAPSLFAWREDPHVTTMALGGNDATVSIGQAMESDTKTKHGRAPKSTAPDRNARARAKVLAKGSK